MRRVKRCWNCGCLFICNDVSKYQNCKEKEFCLCNSCYLRKFIKCSESEICDIIIIKSGFKKEDDISEESQTM